jgi:putative methyltransferase (TIGR04325 family)
MRRPGPRLNKRVKAAVRELLPPVLVRALRPQGRWHIRFTERRTWSEARAASTGYDLPAILERVTDAALKVKRGEAVYERDSVLFDRIEYSWPVLAGLMWAAARNAGRLSVLDFGGSLGTSYFQNRKFLRDLPVRWRVVEQPHFVEVGRQRFAEGGLEFFGSIDEAVAAGAPDIVMFGGSLQFVERPFEVLEHVARIPHKLLILDSTPFAEIDEDRVCVQHVPPSIYSASYPSHVFSRPTFERWLAARGWTLLESFDTPGGEFTTDRGLRLALKGMLLSR